MLSYRHAFHAGNHADVLKHLSQVLVLESLCQKEKPFVYFDTHSGAGAYSLDADEAVKTQEFLRGIVPLMQRRESDSSIALYQQTVAPFFQQRRYPGSPAIAMALMREQDRVILVERHNQEIENLRATVNALCANTVVTTPAIHHRDGFEALVALTPPQPKRGVVLIDPSYELRQDYQAVSRAVTKAYKRWSTGIYMVWYPLLAGRAMEKQHACDTMLARLQSLDTDNWLNVQYTLEPESQAEGMYGSGVFIINPPWLLDEKLTAALTTLCSQESTADFRITQPEAD